MVPLSTPPSPSILFQYPVGTKCHMRTDVDSHEIGQQGPQRPSVQMDLRMLDTSSSECPPLQHSDPSI